MITPFQNLLRQKPRPPVVSVLRDRLDVDRSTLYRWSKGESYPPYTVAAEIINILAEYGVAMDYNDIYKPCLPEDE
ncbi:DNA-packaging protein [Endozoicomonas sp. SESOKO2]|uniref:DNA-packaging protein n=1 Tax=Endozoicomonas sp. SESOKO2 TaxID=2828743 RepID=UPI0021495061|nr:DNA-packaging protein [Endozoicomonas sp. SESOKO2]